eukprot:scaffold171_cov284-Chaetoceros_neogracile.AAC.1
MNSDRLSLIPPLSHGIQRDAGSGQSKIDDELEISGSGIKRVLSNLSFSLKSWTQRDRLSSFDTTNVRRNSMKSNNISEENLDENRLFRSLEDAGRDADGISAVEVWILDRTNQGPRLVQPEGGFWCSPDFVPDDYDALSRIEDKGRADYEYAHPLLPGTGLAGTLWNDRLHHVDDGQRKKRNNDLGTIQERTIRKRKPLFLPNHIPLNKSFQSMTNLHANYRTGIGTAMDISNSNNSGGFTWRHMKSILADPYQPTFQRLVLMEEAGFSICAGIHFDIQGTEGIVLFLANDAMPVSRLNAADNLDYMRAAANLVGSAAAMTLHRMRLGARLGSVPASDNKVLKKGHIIFNHVSTYIQKLRGGNLQPPTSMPLDEASLTFIGVFLTLVVLHAASDWIEKRTGAQFILGPFGALMTLQFGLTMAPVGQPRNILFGQIIATTIGLLFLNISEDYLHRYLRISLATATAIATMLKLGVAHPPAGASVLIIASGDYGWNVLPSMLLSNIIAILMSTLINNLSEQRQYPTFLHIGEKTLSDALCGFCVPKDDPSFANEFIKKRSASLQRREATVIPITDHQQNEFSKNTGIATKERIAKSSTNSIGSGRSNKEPLPVLADEEDEDIGLDIFSNEDDVLTSVFMTEQKLATNLTPTSTTSSQTGKYTVSEVNKTNRASENRTSSIIPSLQSQRSLLSPLEEIESNPFKKKRTKPARMHLNYGAMFMVPMSLGHELDRDEEMADDDSSQESSSDLEDIT